MGNRWHLWDSGAGKPDQLTLVLPGGHGVTQCKMCNAHQEEGLALSFPRPVLTTALGHHSPLCSTSSFKFSSCPCISQDTDTQQLREGWQGCSPEKQQVIGTGTVPPAQQCLDLCLWARALITRPRQAQGSVLSTPISVFCDTVTEPRCLPTPTRNTEQL